ncbi:MAG: potassium transporter TrkG [Mariprofundaceae bacterium]|nr:potassium transporter TrkG [Mariprofundaceae bacterium]
MNFRGVAWTIGILAAFFGASMLLPALVAWHYDTEHLREFVAAGLIVSAIGFAMMRLAGGAPESLSHRDGFLIVALAWVVLSLLGAVPFWMTGTAATVMDALFESASGLTTTGATVFSGLDEMPASILFWRSMEEWVGGMGIIVLAVAIMPLLGIGGMQLFRAEAPGPVKDKLTARVAETGKILWFMYLAMTCIVAVVYWLLGMSGFDAINHAMCTISIGGFSTHDASMGHFDSLWIRLAAVCFMFMAGINFTLHFSAMRRGLSGNTLRTYFIDDEFRTYFKWMLVLIAIVGLPTLLTAKGSWDEVLFNTVAVATTTGFAVSDYSQWPVVTSLILFATMFVGACAGSTGGGMKIVRVLLLFRQGMREVRRLIHPHAVVTVKLGGTKVTGSVVEALWGFFVLYIVCFMMIAVLVAASGVDMLTSLAAAAACITNTGPGFGGVGPAENYAALPDFAKAVLMFGMVLGRLEIFTFFVLLVPEFWRK